MTGWSLLQWVSGIAVLLSVAVIWLSSSESDQIFLPLFVIGMIASGIGVTLVLDA